MFPPIHQSNAPEFNDFNFWKIPVQDFPLPELSPPSPTLSARSDTSSRSAFSRIRNFSLGRQGSRQFTLPPPVVQEEQANWRYPARHIPSSEMLRKKHANAMEAFEASSSSTLVDSEDDREKRARKRLSMESMPGSLPDSPMTYTDDFDEDEEAGMEGLEEGVYDAEVEDPEEAAEEGFDEDYLAMGEMEHVPFL